MEEESWTNLIYVATRVVLSRPVFHFVSEIKSKAVLVPKHHNMKAYGAVDLRLHVFYTSQLDDERSASRSVVCIPGCRSVTTWVAPKPVWRQPIHTP
jgi:hypothetical protein